MIQTIEYVSAGRTFTGYLARPAAAQPGSRPAAIVFHGGTGLTDHERERIRLLAELGHVALAPDLFGERFTDRGHGMRVIGALIADPALLRGRTRDALAHLVAQPGVDAARVAAIGHCFGGLAALELARSGAELAAAVSYHGGLATRAPARAGAVRARVLACTGADDPHCPRDQRAAFEDELTAAGVDWQHHIYSGARHGFTVAGADYHELADRRSWRATRELLAEVMAAAA